MTGFIYAIGDETGRVKIGWSQQPVRRLAKISSDCSSVVTLLGIVQATQSQEKEIHTLLSPWRINREWFRHEETVAVFVSMLGKLKPQLVSNDEQVHPLRAYRERQDPPMNRRQLADLLGVSTASVSRWEAGERKPDEGALLRIMKKTGIPASALRPDLAELLRTHKHIVEKTA